MCWALIGAVVALVLLSRWHDRQLRVMRPDSGAESAPYPVSAQ
jgi:hypothetical protein